MSESDESIDSHDLSPRMIGVSVSKDTGTKVDLILRFFYIYLLILAENLFFRDIAICYVIGL